MANMLKKFGTLTRSKRPKSELWLKIKGQKMKSPYNCVWPAFCESRPDINWASLTTHEATYPHVRLYELSGEDSLSMFVSFLEQLASIPATMAIILINTDESYDLDAKFSTHRGDSPVPVVVVKRKTGKALLEKVKQYPRNVDASIEGEKGTESKPVAGDKAKAEKVPEKKKEKVSLTSQNSAVTLPPEEKCDSVHDLEVRVKTEAGFQRHSFKFSLGKLQQSLPSINWIPLTTFETTYQHIRIHELRADDSLSYFMATLSSIPAARAMILVNHSRSYELSAKFLSEEQCSPVPMLLVTQETGRELLRLVGDHQREVEARVGVSGSSRPLSLELEKRESLFAGPESAYPVVEKPRPDPVTSGVVKSGLKIKLKSETRTKCRSFDYVSAPFSSSLRPITWVDLTTGEATYPHVRLHELNEEEDSLSFFMSTMASITATMAIILVNSDDSFTFSRKFQSEEQSPPVPVLVVTKETGRELLKLVRENFREVEVEVSPNQKIQAISSPSSPLSWAFSPLSPTPPTSIVKKGLKLKIKSDSGSQLYDFDYMSAPFSLSLRFVNWVDITNKEATYPHVRLHELSEEDSLSFFMSTMASIPATMAVVLINSQSGYDLGKKFNSEEQGSPVPMVVVTKETGKELLRLVEENPRKVTVKVELSPNAKPNSSPALSSPSPLVSPEPGLRLSQRVSRVMNKGLHLKLTNQANPESRCFDYAWAACNQSARPLEWLGLTTSETTYQHIRLHELKKDDSLSYFMATLSSIPAARAMILVNSENSFRLSEKFDSEDQIPPVPVLVVTKETGRELLKLVEANPREVEVKVEVSAAVVGKNASAQSSWSGIGVSPAGSYQRKHTTHTLVKNGVEIKLVGKSEPQSFSFDYGWGSFNQSLRPFQQLPLALHEATYQHFRLHELTQEDSLSFFMSMMASIPATMAIVLINSDNSYQLSEKFLSEEQSPPVPVLLVTQETGRELLRLVKENPREVEAKIHSEDREPLASTQTAPVTLPAVISVTPCEDEDAKGLHVKVGLIGTEQIFEYAPGPFRQEIRDIDWVSMTACETTYPHIRLHDLKKEDSLTFFMSTMASTPAAKAIIFINSENNLRLLEKFQSEEQSPPVPVLVVAKETGRELLRLVGEHPRDVHVKVDQLSCQDVIERGGLQIQLANKKGSQPSSFDFRWANFDQSPRGIDWHPLTQFEATYQHIRVHQLHDEDSLSDFWSMSIPAMMAVILINPEDSFTLAEKFQSEEYSPPVPVLVVTKETGSELLRIMEENPREMEARIETALKGFLTPNVSSPTSPEQSLLRLSIGGSGTYETGLMKRGMEVRLPTEETKKFDYAWPPFCNSPRQIEWLALARHQVTYPHIQLYELKHGESLTFFMNTLGSMTSAKALVLVNMYDGFEIDKKFFPQNDGLLVPTIVVPRKTGEALFEIMRLYGREVSVRLQCSASAEAVETAEPTKDDPDEWDVIQAPEESIIASSDVPSSQAPAPSIRGAAPSIGSPSFSSIVESLPTYTAITDGLLLRSQKSGKERISKFDYVWAQFCSARRDIDWVKVTPSTTAKLPSDLICLYDLKKKDKNMTLYDSLLRSPKLKALVLVNTCNSYKIPQEFLRRTKVSVLVVTSSTGQALATVLKESRGTAEARVEFGSSIKEFEWCPPTKSEMKIDWEDSDIRKLSMTTERPKDRQYTSEDLDSGLQAVGSIEQDSLRCEEPAMKKVQTELETEQPTTVEETRPVPEKREEEEVVKEKPERRDEPQSEAESGRRSDEGEGGATGDRETQPQTTSQEEKEEPVAAGTTLQTPDVRDAELEESIAEFMIVEAPEEPQQATPTADTQQDMMAVGLTPLLLPSVEDSVATSPTMPPPQEMVPYNPGPYPGEEGDELGEDFLEDVSRSGCVTEPGCHVGALLPESSESEWREPIKNGLQIRSVDQQQGAAQSFTYKWSRVTDCAQPMDWIAITERDDYLEEHIRLYQLSRNSDLQLLMVTLDTSPAAGLLLVNNKNTYDIDGKFFPPGEIGWPVPVMVVTSDTGKNIKALLEDLKGRAEARVETEHHKTAESPEVPRGRMASFLKGLLGGNAG